MNINLLGDLLLGLYSCSTQAELGDFAVRHLAALFPGEQVMWCHFHQQRGVLGVFTSGTSNERLADSWRREHSNSAHEFRETTLYRESHEFISVERPLTLDAEHERQSVIGLIIGGKDRGLPQEDRDLLQALQPHFRQAWERVTLLEALQEEVDAFTRHEGVLQEGRLVMAADGTIRHADIAARDLLARFFPGYEQHAHSLPQSLHRMISRRRRTSPFKFDIPGSTLVVTPHAARGKGSDRMISLQEQGVRHRPLLPNRLTPRERDVWRLVGQGKTNSELASELGVKQRTVEKHVENLFQKLGVENRAAAIVQWLAASQPAVHVVKRRQDARSSSC